MKLKADFPHNRFRVYYTQYDNPIVRFHMVRSDEPMWISNEQLKSATAPSFSDAVVYDTEYIDSPIIKRIVPPN